MLPGRGLLEWRHARGAVTLPRAVFPEAPHKEGGMKRLVTAAVLILCAGAAVAATTTGTMGKKAHAAMKGPDHGLVTPDDVKWGPAPPVLQAGAEMAVLQGDPASAGPYTVRLKMPDGYKIMPHWHPTTENVTVISGDFHLGAGATFDDTKGSDMPAGSFG